MSFWDHYLSDSLQSPWIIGPLVHKKTIKEPKTKKVFILKNDVTDSQYSMISKMILALKYKPNEVTLIELEDTNLEFLKDWQDSKKILLFGKDFTNQFASFINLYGNQLMATHSLNDLEANIELKKQTWQHLKKFDQLK
jgi:DNA polymerase III psi subunit